MGTDASIIRSSIERLERRLRSDDLRGYDPYDALSSPLFALPGLRSLRLPRAAAQQLLKRLPVNVRPLLGIRKGYNPVSVALALEGYLDLAEADPADGARFRAAARDCVERLRSLRSTGYSGDCWGYDFDWETRYGPIPAGTPTIVATGLVTDALFGAWEKLGFEDALDMCVSATRFVLFDLPRVAVGGGFCWAYSPVDRQLVLNATMKGARLCAQVYSATGDRELVEVAAGTVEFVASQQLESGAWPYAVGDDRTWCDNFHTAYVLDCLDDFARYAADTRFEPAKERGWRFYRASFFADDTVPKYFHDRLYPVDATACAQSMLTLCRFGDVATATRVALWAIDRMQRSDGHFAYQLRRRYAIKIPYVRWSSAYMFAGLSRTLAASKGSRGE